MRCLFVVLGVIVWASVASADQASCLAVSGRADTYCLEAYSAVIERCRRAGDAECEAAAREEGGVLAQLLARPEAWIRAACDDSSSEALGYIDENDVVKRAGEWCTDFAEDFANLAFADNLAALDPAQRRCQLAVSVQLRKLRRDVVRMYGSLCALRNFTGGSCSRNRRDARLDRLSDMVISRIENTCGAAYESLGLGPLDELVAAVATRARHFAIRVLPPNDLGPTANFGPYPVGVTTLPLTDPSRMNVAGDAPRPVLTEVYYPSTAQAIAGVPRDVVTVLDLPIVATPAYRDVAIAAGQFPLVLFSHGNSGIRFQSFFFAAHLASHGYVVASPDHHGNTFVDLIDGIVDSGVATNRPLDMSFLIDQFLAFNTQEGNRFEGSILPDAIGASGHSFGGFTVFMLAGPGGDPRIKAILPQAPAAVFTDDFLQAITIPVLIIGGSIDETTEFEPNQQRPYDLLPSGARIVGLAEVAGGGHFTFSDFCEVDRGLLAFLGGFDEACEPRHLPWRHAHELVNYLSLNFFDAVLRNDDAARARLLLADGFDDLRLTTK